MENKKLKNVDYRVVRAQNAQVSEAILVKAGSVLALGFFPSVLDRSKSPEESCWNTSILQRISALRGFREGLFILPKNDDSDV